MLTELEKNPAYQKRIDKLLNHVESTKQQYIINLNDESHAIQCNPHANYKEEPSSPLYVTLIFYDKLLHNCMLDYGASHTLMQKIIMEQLGLEISRPYHDIYSFNSRKVKCLEMIKYLVVTLAQIPTKSIMMDVIIAYVPSK